MSAGRSSWLVGLLLALILSTGAVSYAMWQLTLTEFWTIGVRYENFVMVPTNQLLNPVGRRIEFSNRPVDMAFSPTGDEFAVLVGDGVRFFSMDGQSLTRVLLPGSSFLGIAYSPDGQLVVASQSSAAGSDSIAFIPSQGPRTPRFATMPTGSVPTGLVFDRSGKNLYVALNRQNVVARYDMERQQIVQTVAVGVAPLAVELSPDGSRLFVTNWGGRRTQTGDRIADSSGTPVVVDQRGIASSGTVSVIVLSTFQRVAEIPVGVHPSAIRITPDGRVAAVANANSDSVSFIDVGSLQVIDTVNIPAFPSGFFGSSPTNLAFNQSGSKLYVTSAGNNAVAVMALVQEPTIMFSHPLIDGSSYRPSRRRFVLRGFMPSDWYPIAIGVRSPSSTEDRIYVANAKGVGSRDARARFAVDRYLGSLSVFSIRQTDILLTETVIANNTPFRNTVDPPDSPTDLGELGIEHVFLIIKENRTYDQVLGDLGQGNGDPTLTEYGWNVTPNQHKLALDFVTMDNFYTSGAVSADGHQWLTQATTTDYVERGFSGFPRSYPFSGDDAMAFATSGFIWDHALKAGRTVRVYGEFARTAGGHSRPWMDYYEDSQRPDLQIRVTSRTDVASLRPVLEPDYPSFVMNVPDVFRSRIFLNKFREFERTGNLPNLVILLLPGDHTAGILPGLPKPEVAVAENDLALGQIIDAITHSQFWPRSAIFVTEDDAQNGVDHVDGHRTICLVISPYARRAVVDSRNYNQTSILRTIEEMLQIPPMNKFDASALPMRSVFTRSPNFAPFVQESMRIPVAMNPPLAMLQGPEKLAAIESATMDFSRPDAAPAERLNRILWHAAKGWNTPYPSIPHAFGCLPGEHDEDDEEEEEMDEEREGWFSWITALW